MGEIHGREATQVSISKMAFSRSFDKTSFNKYGGPSKTLTRIWRMGRITRIFRGSIRNIRLFAQFALKIFDFENAIPFSTFVLPNTAAFD
jgi:hypothetical protein